MLNANISLKAKVLAFLAIPAVAAGTLVPAPAAAHEDCYKQSIPFGWTWVCKPHVHVPEPTHSTIPNQPCYDDPTREVYKVTLYNSKDYKQTYYFDDVKYVLDSNYHRTHSKLIKSGTTSCNLKTYSFPRVAFDRYANDGKYTKRSVLLKRSNTAYEFWRDGSVIKFSSK